VRAFFPQPADNVELMAAYSYPTGPRWLRANVVASADGAGTDGATPAGGPGRSAGLSGPADRRVLGALRAVADVLLVGAQTVRVERYRPVRPRAEYAAARRAAGQPPAPTIAVVSGSLDGLGPTTPLFTDALVRGIVLTTEQAPPDRLDALRAVADVLVAGERSVDVVRACDLLAERGLARMLCEGGPRLLGQVLAAGLLDELCLTVSPLLAGGDASRVIAGTPGLPLQPLRLAQALEEDGFLFLRYLVERGGTDDTSSSPAPAGPA
jgi:riboflavin biosynthesis pyrimidine reductase